MAVGFLRRWMSRRHRVDAPELRQKLMGIEFDNPVGLGAGFDKNAEMYVEMAALGFGFVEIGTVTARAQPGNPRPRLFRLKRDQALINRMGFNNDGAARVSARLRKGRAACTLGVNIGRSKVVSNDEAIADYLTSLELLWETASYVTVNVSSPNTPGLRSLQGAEQLGPLLSSVRERLAELAAEADRPPPPVVLKVAPDLDGSAIDDLCGILSQGTVDAVICSNTTIERTGLVTPPATVESMGAGGLSGRPLRKRTLEVIRAFRRRLGDDFPIIGSGGIFDAESAWNAVTAGASLVQIYTGFIYRGPGIVREINRGLLARLREAGLSNIREAVGICSADTDVPTIG
jgi:dihydroorotate dehydrogenase